MSGLFGTLGTATSGLNTNQTALQTTSHNLANTNTDGYSRQRVQMQTTFPYQIAGTGLIGTGVKAAAVERVTDQFITGQVQKANSTYQAQAQVADVLGQLEAIYNEPSDTGLLKQMDTLTDAWSQLANHPELETAKTLVVEQAKTFLDTLHTISNQTQQLGSDTTSSIAKSTLDLNQKLASLQTVNEQIFTLADQQSTPNDLLDMRDSLLKDISSLVPIDTSFDASGRVNVMIGGQVVLDQKNRQQIDVVITNDQGTASLAKGGNQTQQETITDPDLKVGTLVINQKQVTIASGTIGGLQQAQTAIDQRLSELDQIAAAIGRSTNLVYTNGQSETDGFYTLGDGQHLSQTMAVNGELSRTPSKLQSGKTGDAPAGDGSKSLAMVKLASTKLTETSQLKQSFDTQTMSFTTDATGLTHAGRYNTLVTKNGIETQQASQRAQAQLSVLNQLEYKQQSISGVSMNEEMSDVIRFQQGFQANAKLISVVSEMLDTLINRTGV